MTTWPTSSRWSSGRRRPITVRLVKGAYWDAETVARRSGGVGGAGLRAQGGDRRQLRALHPAPPRPPRRGAGRVRIAQPALARLRGQLRPRASGSPTTPSRSSCSTAWPSPCTRPSSASACACASTGPSASSCPAWPTSCAACWRTPPTRASCGTASPRAARSSSSWRRRSSTPFRAPRRRRRCPPPTPPRPRRTSPSRCASGGGVLPGPPSRSRSTGPPRRGCAIRRRVRRGAWAGIAVPRSSTASRCARRATITSVDPARFDHVVATSASCTAADADAAVAAALRAAPAWRAAPAMERAGVLFRAAEWMRRRRDDLAALAVLRGRQAMGPGRRRRVRGHRLLRVLRPRGAPARRRAPPTSCSRHLARPTASRYQGKGVTAVISPWNFPLAIPTRHDGGCARGRQPGHPQAGRADPGRGVAARRGAARGGRAAPGCSSSCRARRGRRRPPGRAPRRRGHRLHRLAGGRPRDQSRGRGAPQPGQRHAEAGRRASWAARTRSSSTPTPTPTRRCPRLPTRPSATRVRSARPPRALIVLDSVYDAIVERLVGCSRELLLGHPATLGVAGRPGHRRRRPRAGARLHRSSAVAGHGAAPARRRPGRRLVRRPDDRRGRRSRRPDRHRGDLRSGADRAAGPRLRPRHRAGQRHRLRAHGRALLPLAGAPAARPRPSCGPATST